MTLGPKFFSCNKMAITRRTRHLRKRKALILEALVETHLSSYSKRDKAISKILTSASQLNDDYVNDDYVNEYVNSTQFNSKIN